MLRRTETLPIRSGNEEQNYLFSSAFILHFSVQTFTIYVIITDIFNFIQDNMRELSCRYYSMFITY